ncbi:34070_t:CDS:2, partial [Gigaspora margarita]
TEFNKPTISCTSIVLRTPATMKRVIQQGHTKEYSLYDMENSFWSLPKLNVYQVCLPDHMHHLDLGLYNHQVIFTHDLLREWCGSSGITEFDNRLTNIPRFPGLKLFKKGLGNIKRFTAAEFRAMMQQLVFVVDGIIRKLHKKNYTIYQAINIDKQLVQRQNIIKYLHQLKEPMTKSKKQMQHALIGNSGTFNLLEFDEFVNSYKRLHQLAPEALDGFYHLISALDEFFNSLHDILRIDNMEIFITWYNSAISSKMSQYNTYDGTCFAKVLMVCSVRTLALENSFELALVRWYDFKHLNRLYKYECPWITLTNIYSFIPVDSLIELVHIVPCFNSENEYFAN